MIPRVWDANHPHRLLQGSLHLLLHGASSSATAADVALTTGCTTPQWSERLCLPRRHAIAWASSRPAHSPLRCSRRKSRGLGGLPTKLKNLGSMQHAVITRVDVPISVAARLSSRDLAVAGSTNPQTSQQVVTITHRNRIAYSAAPSGGSVMRPAGVLLARACQNFIKHRAPREISSSDIAVRSRALVPQPPSKVPTSSSVKSRSTPTMIPGGGGAAPPLDPWLSRSRGSAGQRRVPDKTDRTRSTCSLPGRRQKAAGSLRSDVARSVRPARQERGLIRNRTAGRPPAGVRTPPTAATPALRGRRARPGRPGAPSGPSTQFRYTSGP